MRVSAQIGSVLPAAVPVPHELPTSALTVPPAPIAGSFTPAEAPIDATTSQNVGASVSALEDAALAKVPPELRAEAKAVVHRRGVHPDVITCIDVVVGYRDLVPLPQAKWLMTSLAVESEPPELPLSLTQTMALLKRGGPPPARGPLHTLALVGLGLDANAASDIANADLTTLQELFYCVGPKNPLTPTIYKTLLERREAARPQVTDHVSPRTTFLFNESFDGRSTSGLKATPPLSSSAEDLAKSFVARGRAILASGDMDVVRQSVLDSSVLSRDGAACLAGAYSNDQKDGFNRIVLFNNLTQVLRLTSGEVFQVCDAIHQREVNARPQFRGMVNRPESTAQLPVFPLQPGASYSAEIYVNPQDPRELFHEMGHAFECVRPDVLRAALAYRQSLAIGRPRLTNDLNVIYKVAPDAETQRTCSSTLRHASCRL